MTWGLAGLLISLGALVPSFSGGDSDADSGAGFDRREIPLADTRPDDELPSDHDGEPQVDLGRVPVLLLDRSPTNGDAGRLVRTVPLEERTARWEAPFPKIAPVFFAKQVHPEERHWTAPKIRNLHWPHGPPLTSGPLETLGLTPPG